MFTLSEVEGLIKEQYLWFHEQNPNIKPQESGQLGALWGLFDLLIEEEQING